MNGPDTIFSLTSFYLLVFPPLNLEHSILVTILKHNIYYKLEAIDASYLANYPKQFII